MAEKSPCQCVARIAVLKRNLKTRKTCIHLTNNGISECLEDFLEDPACDAERRFNASYVYYKICMLVFREGFNAIAKLLKLLTLFSDMYADR